VILKSHFISQKALQSNYLERRLHASPIEQTGQLYDPQLVPEIDDEVRFDDRFYSHIAPAVGIPFNVI